MRRPSALEDRRDVLGMKLLREFAKHVVEDVHRFGRETGAGPHRRRAATARAWYVRKINPNASIKYSRGWGTRPIIATAAFPPQAACKVLRNDHSGKHDNPL